MITGGNSGIGLGMAQGIAQAGGEVCIWGTNAAKNSAAVEQLATYGTPISAQRCDVADGDAVARPSPRPSKRMAESMAASLTPESGGAACRSIKCRSTTGGASWRSTSTACITRSVRRRRICDNAPKQAIPAVDW